MPGYNPRHDRGARIQLEMSPVLPGTAHGSEALCLPEVGSRLPAFAG